MKKVNGNFFPFIYKGKLTVRRKLAKILNVSRQSHHPIETPRKKID